MEEEGVTQKMLAQRMGCSQQHVSSLLKGETNLTLETIARLEKALGIDIVKSELSIVHGYDFRPEEKALFNEPRPEYKRMSGSLKGNKTYPIGIQTFENIVLENCYYVDKTRLVYNLANSGKFFFLSRPRRFGKSLLLSTLEAYFKGRRDLFQNLAMAELENEWVEYPVLHFDWSGQYYLNLENLEETLDLQLGRLEEQFGVKKKSDSLALRFRNLIASAYEKTGKGVVILIDEYDKPIVDNLLDYPLLDTFKKILQGFYGAIKAEERYVRFCMLTGVSKLGKLSIFSALNNLLDVSMNSEFSEICGITEEELRQNFDKEISEMATALGMTKDECYEEFKKMYDGYHFCGGAKGIYNPFSVLNALSARRFASYWYETGTPTFLVDFLRDGRYKLDDLETGDISESVLTGVNYYEPDPVTLLYQTGYLTIKDYDRRFRTYQLDYPNDEVRGGFMQALSLIYTPLMESKGDFSVYRFVKDIEAGDAQSLMNRFVAFFADSDYQVQGDYELYFQNTFAVMLKMMGMYVQTERHTSNGRIDVVFETEFFVYIIEIKRNASAAEALAQIKAKGYDKPYRASGKKIYTIGVSFSTDTKRIEEWIME